MENRFKQRIARLFRSCKTKNLITDVVIDHINTHFHHHDPHLINPHHNKHIYPRTFPSFCRPKFPQTSGGHKCPPTSPILPPYHEFYSTGSKPRPKKHRKNRKRMMTSRSHIRRLDFDDFPEFEYKGLFSSDEEENDDGDDDDDDRSTLFSSRSFSRSSSDSAESLRRRRAAEAAVKDSFAVVKRTSDPYGDFKDSMMEMIIEKQIFGERELEKLLECFLSLNSEHHHGIIVDVFTEVCEALFYT